MRTTTIRGNKGLIKGSLEGVWGMECYDIGRPSALRLSPGQSGAGVVALNCDHLYSTDV